MAITSGYSSKFLGAGLSLPKLDKKILAPLIQGRGHELKYTHFSVFVHKSRRLPVMTAVNIRGEAYNALSREGSEPWKLSDLVDETYQIDNRFYGNDDNTFDRGHLVRRVDPCWGSRDVADQAEADTFTWPNCTPQHKKLNQKGGIWYQLEQHVMENGVKNKTANISVFAGPVLDENDPLFIKQYIKTDVPVPLMYWKVIVWKKSDGRLYAVGFMMSQWEWIKAKLKPVVKTAAGKPPIKDDYFENLKFDDHKTYQVPLAMIEKATGISFNWEDVTLPYKGNRAKVVKAAPLKKIYPFKEVRASVARLSATRKHLSTQLIQKELDKSAPLSDKTAALMVKNGEGYLLKRYQIQNITL